MIQFTDYTVFWNTDKNSGKIQFFNPNSPATLCTQEIGQRNIYMMIDLMQTKGVPEFFMRFGVLLKLCREKMEITEVFD